MMKKEIYRAAASGNVEFLKEAKAKDVEAAAAIYSDDDLLGLTSQGNNIIHVAALFGHLDFMKAALEYFEIAHQRELICKTNSDGDTPLHFAAKQRTQALAELLIITMAASPSPSSPWSVQNKQGNTPLHVALMNGRKSVQVAAYLIEVGPEVAAYTNNLKQTPLHLAVMYDAKGTEMSAIHMINSLNSQGAALSTKNISFVQEKEDISLSLVRSLLQTNSEVCCLCDADGMTPLLRAAIRSNLLVVDAIINECPESIEVCDPKGKNLLHHIRFPTFLKARKFLEKPEIPVLLIDKQDDDGNTPMHIAVMNHDFKMVKAMVEHNANFAIENNEGVSAQTLFDQFAINNNLDVSAEAQIESKLNKFRHLVDKENKKEVIMDELMMSKDLYEAVGNGEWDRLREIMLNDENQFLSRLPDGSNIIHLAIQGLNQYKFVQHPPDNEPSPSPEEQFIVDALKKYPFLFCQTNRFGETPLHLDIFHWLLVIRQGIMQLYRKIIEELMNLKGRGELPLPPWKVKDVRGNTILHCAIKYNNIELAKYFTEIDANLAREVNHSKQTPLHLLCQKEYLLLFGKRENELAKLLVEKGGSTVYSLDVEGFTPLLRAAQHFWTEEIAIEILKQHPQSIRQIDPQGRNFFHHINHNFLSKTQLCEVVPEKERKILITQRDDQGNTPLDLALQKRQKKKGKFLTECSGAGLELLLLSSVQKESTLNTMHTDPKFCKIKDIFKSRGIDQSDISTWTEPDRRSAYYGVSKEEIKEYMNPIGVVAALLATVTFTAAFTVPGGYKGDTGFPNLGKKAAFQVFMVSDVAGMCSSMMVLFCLLWLLSKDNENYGLHFMLVDMTIKLLLISFYATLLAFMTGVYVTTISDTPWLAIFTCVLCSFLILLMRRPHIKILSFILVELPNDPSFWCRRLRFVKKWFCRRPL